ncbi:hypothetical protein ABZ942_11775 [Nocardia sp. NPDC046473]|uniref:hypothetical protein n=1 Tax=Nocardia sp. NPDC046473 TaxID=3155733 RepID=UPI00340E34B5
MKKIRTFGFVCLTAASIVVAGSGLAVADDTTASGSSAGSSALVTGLGKLLSTGSSGGPFCPGGAGCPK